MNGQQILEDVGRAHPIAFEDLVNAAPAGYFLLWQAHRLRPAHDAGSMGECDAGNGYMPDGLAELAGPVDAVQLGQPQRLAGCLAERG